ncbi:hypothetical protein V495_02483 [Pseudogymnoascus sp. VKM F-4514 (FW-929)]|nr:hypothetical protein V495_02483 [Pseudogymnoascus sp. VKM F-4514 (FW-929)]KFY54118.1 hypothetical protein V497_08000 [Pseudogymnoascus sp. VKM F-4516 (FW-969)]
MSRRDNMDSPTVYINEPTALVPDFRALNRLSFSVLAISCQSIKLIVSGVALKLFEKTLKLVEQVLEEAKVKKSQVDAIIPTGSPVHIGVSPDEAVVRGAAIQAQVLSLPSSDEEVCDVVVTALGLGIETSEGICTQLIRRHSIILKARIVSRVFSTLTDNQSKVVLRIFQGERLLAGKNRLLGILEFIKIPLAPRGVPHIDVVFEIVGNAVLTVVAREKESGTEARLVIAENLDRYSGDQIDRIITNGKHH